MGPLGLAPFPDPVTSNPDPGNSPTLDKAASSERTLTLMAIIAALGTPFVPAYTGAICRAFRGKVKPSEHGC